MVRRSGEVIELTEEEFQILELLMRQSWKGRSRQGRDCRRGPSARDHAVRAFAGCARQPFAEEVGTGRASAHPYGTRAGYGIICIISRDEEMKTLYLRIVVTFTFALICSLVAAFRSGSPGYITRLQRATLTIF